MVTDKTKDNLLLCVVTGSGSERTLVHLGPLLSMSLCRGSNGGHFNCHLLTPLVWGKKSAITKLHGLDFPTRKGRAHTRRVSNRQTMEVLLKEMFEWYGSIINSKSPACHLGVIHLLHYPDKRQHGILPSNVSPWIALIYLVR